MIGWNGNRLDGCKFEKPAAKDYRLAFAAEAPGLRDESFPKRVDMRPHCTPVEDQGRMQSCTANAIVGALEMHYFRRDGSAPDLSRMFVYYNTRRLKGGIGVDSGATISEAMAATLAYGACRAELWPYAPELFAQEPPQPAYQDGLGHEALSYARVGGAEGAAQALAAGLPVVFGTFLPARCFEEAATTGRIPPSTPEERITAPSGGHAMLLVGYDLDAQAFLVRNSWGAGWGEAGYCWLPFAEAVYFSPPDAFWTLAQVEQRSELTLIRPSSASSPAPEAMAATAPEATGGSAADALRQQIRTDLDAVRRDARERMTQLRASLRGESAPPPEPDAPAADALGSPCYQCTGTGRCFYCRGTAVNMGYPCNACTSTGSCSVCAGTGKY